MTFSIEVKIKLKSKETTTDQNCLHGQYQRIFTQIHRGRYHDVHEIPRTTII